MRLPIDATTCTILGNHYKQTDAAWTGLDLARAELRKWPGDHHLAIPWAHPEDQARFGDNPDHWAIYRVRPKMEPGTKWKGHKVKSVGFAMADDAWWIEIEVGP